MKVYKITVAAVVAILIVTPVALTMAPTQTHAACSAQGYYSSGGKCGKSFKNYNKNRGNNKNRSNFGFFNFNDRQDDRVLELLTLIAELYAILDGYDNDFDFDDDDSEIDITTNLASNIQDDRATLRGNVDFNSSDEATVWFEWGESRNDLDERTTKVELDDSDDEDFSRTITRLDDDTRYYFRAVGEDEDGERDYGTTRSFVTDDTDNGRDAEPDVDTDPAEDVDEDSAEFSGEVDMNDFDNGRVFFVYGEDEDQVRDIEDDYDTYNQVDEDGEDLQKILVDSDLDSDDSYSFNATGLDSDTRHYFSMCVEFEDEDDDDKIICGGVEDFETRK